MARRLAALTALLAAMSTSSAAPALADAPAAAVTVPPTLPLVAEPTAVRIQVPAKAIPHGHPAAVWVRLVAGNQGVPSAPVSLQRFSGTGWTTVAQLTTGDAGLTHTDLVFPSSSQVRAVYTGSLLRRASVSPTGQVRVAPVVRPAPRPTLGQRAVAEAARHQGQPYVWGAAGPGSFDCSGLTMYVFGTLGRSLPHNAAAQAGSVMPIAVGSQQPGDLIFIHSGGSIGHVGIYAGNGQIWNAPHSGDVVRLEPIAYFGGDGYSVGRVN
ncbi:MAG: NlpC/P60 family protein [Actinomycetota bacterium]|nr:NlpC/P60 family protein [Actinomycetota bacterium]